MLETNDAAIKHAWLSQDFPAVRLPLPKWEIPFTITHSILRSNAAAKRPRKNNHDNKQQKSMITKKEIELFIQKSCK